MIEKSGGSIRTADCFPVRIFGVLTRRVFISHILQKLWLILIKYITQRMIQLLINKPMKCLLLTLLCWISYFHTQFRDELVCEYWLLGEEAGIVEKERGEGGKGKKKKWEKKERIKKKNRKQKRKELLKHFIIGKPSPSASTSHSHSILLKNS